ncbi:MAG TPA: DUF3034 family protein [Candidatus Brocadiia bacterium]|nr:DUF3034 family protein [Candidatus Brocadiia bacterium]
MRYLSVARLALLAALLACAFCNAQQPVKVEKGPPLPLHTIEGVGGVGLTEMAYLVNPSVGENWIGLPSFSATHVQAKHKNAEILSVSETLFKRVELSYSCHYVGLGDFGQTVKDRLGADLSSDYVQMHTLNARALLLNEGEFGQSWLPAVTAGFHYKYNATINDFNRDLGGALHDVVGVKNNQGYEYTITATKMFKDLLPRPFFISATARNSDAAQYGWLGFTDERRWLFEGNVGVLILDNLVLAAEYRQKPNDLNKVPGVLGREDSHWTIAASYIVNPHLNISVAYANLGNMLNHEEPAALWFQVKYEF